MIDFPCLSLTVYLSIYPLPFLLLLRDNSWLFLLSDCRSLFIAARRPFSAAVYFWMRIWLAVGYQSKHALHWDDVTQS